MDKDVFHFSNQSSDNNDDLLLEIANDLNKIINYINDNVLKIKKNNYNEINLQEESKNEKYELGIDNNDKPEIKIKLGKKRKKPELLNENESLKDKEFKEKYEIGNNKEEINKKKKKLKIRNKKNLKKSLVNIIGKIKNIIVKINIYN